MVKPWSKEEKDFYQIATRRIDRSKLMPEFRIRMRDAWLECFRQSCFYVATSGLRNAAEQEKLYAQGRTAPGPIVTQARAGESAHNFGIAIDWVRSTTGVVDVSPDWDLTAYKPLALAAKDVGLEAGYFWKKPDAPHIQVPGYVTGAQLSKLDPDDIKASWALVRATWRP